MAQKNPKTITLTFTLTDSKGVVECETVTTWNDLSAQQVLFVEENLLKGLVALNAEAAKILSSQ